MLKTTGVQAFSNDHTRHTLLFYAAWFPRGSDYTIMRVLAVLRP